MREQTERDEDILYRILDLCDRIMEAKKRFGESFNSFSADPDYRDVIKMNLFQIGENANRLSEDCRSELSGIPWRQVIGMRNAIAHAYIRLDDGIIWNTAEKDIPAMIKILNQNGII